jgi:hypothetical protein
MSKLRRPIIGIIVAAGLAVGLAAAAMPSAFADTGDSLTPAYRCTANGLAVSYRATLPKNINGVWDRTIVYDANAVTYVDRDFTNTASQPGRTKDVYTASMVLASGEAAGGRTIEVFIHYNRNADGTGGQVATNRVIIHTC